MWDCCIIETVGMFLAIEVVLLVFFYIIAPKGNKVTLRTIARGFVERFFLIVALLNGYPDALALFGALKIGTRLSNNQTTTPNYNDFYLVGNLVSVLAAMGFVYWYRWFYNQPSAFPSQKITEPHNLRSHIPHRVFTVQIHV